MGALLALLHRGDAGFDQVEATYRMWRHDQRAAAAWQPFNIAMASGLVAGVLAQHVGRDAIQPRARVRTPRVIRRSARKRAKERLADDLIRPAQPSAAARVTPDRSSMPIKQHREALRIGDRNTDQPCVTTG